MISSNPRRPLKKTQLKRKKRPAKETRRIYGPPARRAWMKLQPCCHLLFDRHREKFNARFPDFNPEMAAADTEARWQEFQGGNR